MGKEFKSGPMVLGMKDSGREIKCAAMVNFTTKMEISMKELLFKIWLTVREV